MYRFLYITSERNITEQNLAYARRLDVDQIDELALEHLSSFEEKLQAVEERLRDIDLSQYDAIITRGSLEGVVRELQHPKIHIPIIPIQFLGATTIHMIATVMREHPEEFERPEVKVWVLSHHAVYIDLYVMRSVFHANVENKIVSRKINEEIFQQARDEGVDFLLCGPQNCRRAQKYGIRAYYDPNVDETETINNTIAKAVEVVRYLRQQNERTQMIEKIMDYCFEALLQTDEEGRMIYLNKEMRRLLEQNPDRIYGRYLWDVIPEIEHADLNRVIDKRENIYGSVIELADRRRAIINLIPNIRGDKVVGAILYLYQKDKIDTLDMQLNQKTYEKGLYARYHIEDIIGQSEVMETCRFRVRQFARHHANVLILGESGTGKELFAQSIHNHSLRRGKPFVAINCGAMPENLLESELFGYVGGAFTGASSKGKKGLIEQADHGTIFLDEIGEMSLSGQVRLLRVLEERAITRIGDDKQTPIDVRIVAATNKKLAQEVQKGHFREDLYYRLNVLTLNIPPLRERGDDVGILAEYFLERYSRENDKDVVLDPEAMQVLRSYSWPGNVRQLRNFCERLVIVSDRKTVGRDMLETQIREIYQQEVPGSAPDHGAPLQTNSSIESFEGNAGQTGDAEEKTRILEALRENYGNRVETANTLHMSRATLWRKMKRYGIDKL